ncbi:hypothetical protein J8I26_05835 [Herbaspirillum sp. LeCh32-8]|uniref:hypothetical protein n=1 Tax=Herbaspirillum sp. LeCh32-8 TaxID=2821356 RepID=UPI001AEB7350|nr:hypothetical protein [Herbaspirillum sp. LeCh32-8]MBP0597613.1 hypothetical protein [Herbaspirillum sp. LeCh32-8]
MTQAFEPQLSAMRDALARLHSGETDVAGLCALWRARGDVMAALPPRYQQVAEDLLGRLEAGSLFTEESCSFSQKDLTDSLNTWLDKAGQTLAQA